MAQLVHHMMQLMQNLVNPQTRLAFLPIQALMNSQPQLRKRVQQRKTPQLKTHRFLATKQCRSQLVRTEVL